MSQSVTEGEFKAVFRRLATGVAVITMRRPGGRVDGVTVNSFTSVSVDPPLVLFCLDLAAGSYESFTNAEHFAVNLLGREQERISRRFAEIGSDRFNGIELLENGADGPPLLSGCLGHLICRAEARYPGGDHTIFVGHVERIVLGNATAPLIYHGGTYLDL